MHSSPKLGRAAIAAAVLLLASGCRPDPVDATCGRGYRTGGQQVAFFALSSNNPEDALHGTAVLRVGSRFRDVQGADPIASRGVQGTYVPLCQYRCDPYRTSLTSYRSQSQAIVDDPLSSAQSRTEAQRFLTDYPLNRIDQIQANCELAQRFEALDNTRDEALNASLQMASERCQCPLPQGWEFLAPSRSDIASLLERGLQEQGTLRGVLQRPGVSQQTSVGQNVDDTTAVYSQAATAGSGTVVTPAAVPAAPDTGEASTPPSATLGGARPTAGPLRAGAGGGSGGGPAGFGPGIEPVGNADPYALNSDMAGRYRLSTSDGDAGGAGASGGGNGGRRGAGGSAANAGLSFFSSGSGLGAGTDRAPASAELGAGVPGGAGWGVDGEGLLPAQAGLFAQVASRYRRIHYRWVLTARGSGRAPAAAPGARRPARPASRGSAASR